MGPPPGARGRRAAPRAARSRARDRASRSLPVAPTARGAAPGPPGPLPRPATRPPAGATAVPPPRSPRACRDPMRRESPPAITTPSMLRSFAAPPPRRCSDPSAASRPKARGRASRRPTRRPGPPGLPEQKPDPSRHRVCNIPSRGSGRPGQPRIPRRSAPSDRRAPDEDVAPKDFRPPIEDRASWSRAAAARFPRAKKVTCSLVPGRPVAIAVADQAAPGNQLHPVDLNHRRRSRSPAKMAEQRRVQRRCRVRR